MTCRLKRLLFSGMTGLVVFLAVTTPAKADLVGTSVTGSLQFGVFPDNCFDPNAGCAGGAPPASDLNSAGTTVTISATATEFGYTDIDNADAADFTGDSLTVTDNVLTASGAFNWTMTFTDTAFSGLNLIQTSDTFTNGGVTGTLAGDTITLTWAGTSAQDGPLSTTFTLAPVPEPSSLVMLATGIAVFIFVSLKLHRI